MCYLGFKVPLGQRMGFMSPETVTQIVCAFNYLMRESVDFITFPKELLFPILRPIAVDSFTH